MVSRYCWMFEPFFVSRMKTVLNSDDSFYLYWGLPRFAKAHIPTSFWSIIFVDDKRIMRTLIKSWYSNKIYIYIIYIILCNVIEWSIYNNMALPGEKFDYMSHSANGSNALQHLPYSQWRKHRHSYLGYVGGAEERGHQVVIKCGIILKD